MSGDLPADAGLAGLAGGSAVSTSCLDFLLIELVPMAYRISAELAAREDAWTRPTSATPAGAAITAADNAPGSTVGGGALSTVAGTAGGGTAGGQGGTASAGMDEEEAREAVFYRLETLGYRVGLGVVEKFSRDKPRPTDPLDTIKFLCKDLWSLLFRKQIDNLKTNHRGVFVLTDNAFRPLARMSFDKSGRAASVAAAPPGAGAGGGGGGVAPVGGGVAEVALARVQPFLYFPAGLVRGALAGLGIEATVHAETAALPGATFQIRTAGARP